MVRDLVDVAVAKVRAEYMETLQENLNASVEEQLLDILTSTPPIIETSPEDDDASRAERKAKLDKYREERNTKRELLRDGDSG